MDLKNNKKGATLALTVIVVAVIVLLVLVVVVAIFGTNIADWRDDLDDAEENTKNRVCSTTQGHRCAPNSGDCEDIEGSWKEDNSVQWIDCNVCCEAPTPTIP